jgi:uncharacterized membrane protein
MKFSISEAIKFGWNVAKSNIQFFVPTFVVIIIISALAGSIGGHSGSYPGNTSSLLSTLVSMLVNFSLIYISLKFVDGQPVEYTDLYRGFTLKKVINYIAASFLYWIMVGVGLILLVVPGVYLAVTFGQFSYAIVDKDLGIIDAFKYSKQITSGEKLHLIGFWLATIGVIILGALALLVGLIWAIPTAMVAGAYVYRKLSS